MPLKHAISTVADGSMKSLHGDQSAARENRVAFLKKHGFDPDNTTLHTLGYDTEDFCRYLELNDDMKGDGIIRDSTVNADAVVVTKPGHAILLPLADCIGAIIHDPSKNILMVSHLGRHNLEQTSGTKCVEFLMERYGINPKNLTVWLSPAAGKENYPLHAFDGRSMHDVAVEQLTRAGILPTNIESSTEDTTTHPDYFSHSEFLKKNQDDDGRFAIATMLT